jgi:hypothetical protein
MTPYKSMPKWGCDRIEAQERFTQSHSHPVQRMVGYACGHLFASGHSHLVARYARRLATSSPSCALLADGHASAVARAENGGRTRPLDAGLEHRLALAPRAQGGLLGGPSAGRMVGRGSVADLATPPDGIRHLVGDGRDTPKRGTQHPLAQQGRQSEPQPWCFGIRFALVMAPWDV